MARDEVYVRHIVDAIEAITSFLAAMDYGRFTEDLRTQSAVVRQIEIIGEAASRLSNDFRSRHDDVPWRDIIGMRNKLIHEYFGGGPRGGLENRDGGHHPTPTSAHAMREKTERSPRWPSGAPALSRRMLTRRALAPHGTRPRGRLRDHRRALQ